MIDGSQWSLGANPINMLLAPSKRK
ncbi:hypothetical protein NC652_034031 [Populus alba x Populus x berolinensis]|uniref:Uncharacterized protein n=1 Tax=Populus alba x Populus x berolinensis TaxID=444605 RepID=A0AAD6LV02_9ROSI|nr:hypothetical protein NC652_034031 [Populus alba x Populus x berolinensis]KAJ6973758.1 hypothetical protein NC653_033939 [Populus alba x Populus x berolinensis]